MTSLWSAEESHSRREGFRQIRLVTRTRLQRFERPSLVDVDNKVELIRQRRFEMVTGPFSVRFVDDTDGAFETRCGKHASHAVSFNECSLNNVLISLARSARGTSRP